jgi:hypothetical protein
MPDNFKSFAELFKSDPGLAPVRKIIKQSDVIVDFLKIFPEMKKVVRPLKVVKKVLFINVDNSILRSELKFKESLMVDKINNYYNEEVVKGIRFR